MIPEKVCKPPKESLQYIYTSHTYTRNIILSDQLSTALTLSRLTIITLAAELSRKKDVPYIYSIYRA